MQTSEEKLGSQPLGKLMVSMAVPAVTAQFINVLYNIVDRIYIGHIAGYGDLALTGVGVTFPIITLISAFSAFAGMGGAPLASIELGRRNHEKGRADPGQFGGHDDPVLHHPDHRVFHLQDAGALCLRRQRRHHRVRGRLYCHLSSGNHLCPVVRRLKHLHQRPGEAP